MTEETTLISLIYSNILDKMDFAVYDQTITVKWITRELFKSDLQCFLNSFALIIKVPLVYRMVTKIFPLCFVVLCFTIWFLLNASFHKNHGSKKIDQLRSISVSGIVNP